MQYAVCGMQYANVTKPQKACTNTGVNANANANTNVASVSVLVLISANANAIDLTEDFNVPSQIWSKKDILHSYT